MESLPKPDGQIKAFGTVLTVSNRGFFRLITPLYGIFLMGLSCFSTFYKETSCFLGRKKDVFRPYNRVVENL